MKVIIAGSRNYDIDTIYETVAKAVSDSGFVPTEIVSGGAQGIDLAGELYAERNNIPVKRFIPDWAKYGAAGGPIRNKEMSEYAEALIAVWDGTSRGTKNMLDHMYRKKKKVFLVKV